MSGWELFAVTTVSLFFKHVLTVGVQATARVRSGRWRHAEDAKMLKAKADAGDAPLAERGQDLIRNSLENEPIFLLLLFGFFVVNTNADFQVVEAEARAAVIYVGVFVGARVFHALFFLFRIAGVRTVAWLVGFLATLGVAAQTLLDVYG